MQKKYNAIVLIGRFQLPHNAHIKIIENALVRADKVIVIVGSAYQPRTLKNPWSWQERSNLIHASLSNSIDRERTIVEPNIDTVYDDNAWAIRVQEIVSKHTKPTDVVALTGHRKEGDDSTFYLDMFPQWEFVDQAPILPTIDATKIRDLYFDPNTNMDFIKSVVPYESYRFLQEFRKTEDYKNIAEERQFILDYKKMYASIPYAPIFMTTDAVVFQSSHVLLVKRRAKPGRGLWALPGGFVDATSDKSLQDAMIRELLEETGIKVPVPVLRGNIQSHKIFDHIDRSARGRTITQAFNIVLPSKGRLPKVKGSDDAEKAKWIHISELNPEEMFEDHMQIVQYFLGVTQIGDRR